MFARSGTNDRCCDRMSLFCDVGKGILGSGLLSKPERERIQQMVEFLYGMNKDRMMSLSGQSRDLQAKFSFDRVGFFKEWMSVSDQQD